ncbi:MAG: V-type ATP synthase subunit B, partial [Methanobacteriota archaeon]
MTNIEYNTVSDVYGPLLVVEKTLNVKYGEIVKIRDPKGEVKRGQVLDALKDKAIIQVFESTSGLDSKETRVTFLGDTLHVPVSTDVLGRVFDGSGRPIDGKPAIIPQDKLDLNGYPINPS